LLGRRDALVGGHDCDAAAEHVERAVEPRVARIPERVRSLDRWAQVGNLGAEPPSDEQQDRERRLVGAAGHPTALVAGAERQHDVSCFGERRARRVGDRNDGARRAVTLRRFDRLGGLAVRRDAHRQRPGGGRCRELAGSALCRRVEGMRSQERRDRQRGEARAAHADEAHTRDVVEVQRSQRRVDTFVQREHPLERLGLVEDVVEEGVGVHCSSSARRPPRGA
jgi:hypothetical protein